MREDKSYSVILDTSFLIRLLSRNDSLHSNAVGYFKYFLKNDIPMYISTVSIAEYCVKGDVSELPLRNVRIAPFNFQHALVAGRFARLLFDANCKKEVSVASRLIIPNDAKILAQANCVKDMKYFVTSDVDSSKLIRKIAEEEEITFEHLDIHIPHTQFYGILDL